MADMTALFGEPPRDARALSKLFSASNWRATRSSRPVYTDLKLSRLPACDECFANQVEADRPAPRNLARVRRSFRGEPAANLNLCRTHEQLWRDRDREDAPPQ